jgi:uncharacterized protein YqgV (UPF0045/DUF77 family)
MNNQINMAIQVLPSVTGKHVYDVVDEAIAIIKASGFPYRVCPFETVIEAPYEDAMNLLKQVQDACYKAGAESLICNVKIQSHSKDQVTIKDKMNKYDELQ